MRSPKRPRGFEDRLLSELKTYVSERNQTMTNTEDIPEKTSRFGRVTKFSLAGAVGAVALGVAAVVALPALTASPAYAVEPSENGTLSIEINSPEDAVELEEELAGYGVVAKVDFPPEGKVCDPNRLDANDDVTQTIKLDVAMSENGTSKVSVKVDPKDFSTESGNTLVFDISEGFFHGGDNLAKEPSEGVTVRQLGVVAAKGHVGKCKPIDDDVLMEVTKEDGSDGQSGNSKNDDGSKSKNKD